MNDLSNHHIMGWREIFLYWFGAKCFKNIDTHFSKYYFFIDKETVINNECSWMKQLVGTHHD